MLEKIVTLGKDNYGYILSRCKCALETTTGFILIPTETVYGIACLWCNDKARESLYQAKERSEQKPFQMLIGDIEMVKKYGCTINRTVEKIVEAFCPGPITIVVPAFNGSKVGFRIPEYKFALDLICYMGMPLAATSANLSGSMPALNIDNALSSLKLEPTLSVDGGTIPDSSCSSTVIEVQGNDIKLLREGPIPLHRIMKVLS